MDKFPKLEARWRYQSFCPRAGDAKNRPEIAVPWSPPGELSVKADPETGQVNGELVFSPQVKLTVTGRLIAATESSLEGERLPEGIELTAEGLGSTTTLRGYFLYGAVVLIAGTVVAVQNDLKKRPVGTQGGFVLFPSTSA